MSHRWAWALVALLVWTGPGRAAETIEQQRDRLRRVQSELDRKRREKDRADRRARELREEADRIGRELDGARRALESTEGQLLETERKRAATEERMRASRRSLGTWEDKLSGLLAAHYRARAVGAEGLFPMWVYEAAVLSDRVTGLTFAVENHAGVVAIRDQLLGIEEELRNLRVTKTRDERRIESARDQMRSLARTEEGRRALLARQIDDLHASARRFEGMIRDLLEKERRERATPRTRSAVAADRWRGRVGWPVAGPVVESFGRTHHPELDTFVISNGVRLRPSAASPVVAVQPGEVLFAGPFMNYGLMALVSHADGLHTIYANLGELTVGAGQKVTEGQAVGRAGRDDRGRPVVYFEMRVDGDPVDPERWVR